MDPQALGPGICRSCWKNYQGSSKPFTQVLDSVITVTNDLQMEEYCACVHPTPPPSHKPTTTGFNLGDLASQYKLEDMSRLLEILLRKNTKPISSCCLPRRQISLNFGALSTPPRSLVESARVRQTLADSGGLIRLNWTVLPLPKVFVHQSPVQLSPVQLSLSLADSGQL